MPMVLEAFIIHFIYEVMREAGLRLPKPIGHAIGIVGAIVIGDAAVQAGIIAPPMIMIVGLTAITSFVVPSLYESVSVLRFAFIFIGGFMGLYGIILAVCILLINVCSLSSLGIPYMSPITPVSKSALTDIVIRRSWKSKKKSTKVQNLPGSAVGKKNH